MDILSDTEYIKAAKKLQSNFHGNHRVIFHILFRERLWNPNANLLLLDVIRICEHCEVYQSYVKILVQLPQFKSIRVLSKWHLDFAGPIGMVNGCDHFLVSVDYTTNFTFTLPCAVQTSTVVITMILYLIQLFGMPEAMVTDNSTDFMHHNLIKFTAVVGLN